MALISTTGVILLVMFAHVWMRRFTSGPLEWLWRSLAYVQWQPLLRRPAGPVEGAGGVLVPNRFSKPSSRPVPG
jgi:hypothetical protein